MRHLADGSPAKGRHSRASLHLDDLALGVDKALVAAHKWEDKAHVRSMIHQIDALTKEEGFFVPEFHQHRLFFADT